MKIKLFTHYDLDGASCYLVFRKLMPFVYCNYTIIKNYNNLSDIRTYIDSEEYRNYDYTFFTDLNITDMELLSEIIPHTIKGSQFPFVFIDHHINSTKYLKDMSNDNIHHIFTKISLPNKNGVEINQCGATLLYKYLTNKDNFIENEKLRSCKKSKELECYLRNVRRHDVGEFTKDSEELDTIYKFFNFYMFTKYFEQGNILSFIPDKNNKDKVNYIFTPQIIMVLDSLNASNSAYIKEKCNAIRKIKIENYNVGLIFADRLVNEISSNQFRQKDNIYDIMMIVELSNGSVSLRSKNESDVDVSKIATQLGGGGQLHAAGFNLFNEQAKDIKTKVKKSF